MKISEIVRALLQFGSSHGDVDVKDIHFVDGQIVGYEIDPQSVLDEIERWPANEEEKDDRLH